MSIGPLGMIGSVTAGQLQQTRTADADKATQEARDHSREIDSAQKAEEAAGIGRTDEDEGASDRDADGRRLWERPQPSAANSDPPPNDCSPSPVSLDPSGQAGANLDLTG